MAELASKPKRRGGRYCVAGAPNNQSFQNTLFSCGITMHQFPTDAVLREKWIKFVQRHRRDLKPEGKYTLLCSAHFEASCYNFPIRLEGIQMNRILIKGSVPTRDTIIASLHSFHFSILILSRDKCFSLYLKLKLSFMGTDRSPPWPLDFGMHYP